MLTARPQEAIVRVAQLKPSGALQSLATTVRSVSQGAGWLHIIAHSCFAQLLVGLFDGAVTSTLTCKNAVLWSLEFELVAMLNLLRTCWGIEIY